MTEHNNGELIYNYTVSNLDAVNKGIERTNQKLTTLLASGGILLKFGIELPDHYNSLLALKIIICLLIILSITFCLIALRPNQAGETVEPQELIDEWFYKTDEEIRVFIATQFIETDKQIQSYYKNKAKYLTYAYSCIGIGAICFGCSGIISTIFQ